MGLDHPVDIKAEPNYLSDEGKKKCAQGRTFPLKRGWNSKVALPRPGGNNCSESVPIEASRLAKHDTGRC